MFNIIKSHINNYYFRKHNTGIFGNAFLSAFYIFYSSVILHLIFTSSEIIFHIFFIINIKGY